MDKQSSGISYEGGLIWIMAGLSLNEWGVLFGILVGAATFANNWYYKHREDRRQSEAHRARINRLMNDRRRHDVASPYRRRCTDDGQQSAVSYSKRSGHGDE